MTTSATIVRTNHRHRDAAPKKTRGEKPSGYKLTRLDRRERSRMRWGVFS